jgi:Ran-binding protein 9/10
MSELLVNNQHPNTYTGTGKSDLDAAAVRSNNPIPQGCGIYYFEVTIVSKGRDGYIAIGFQASTVPLGRLPGWEDLSWGYHGDDGHSFCCCGTGKQYGYIQLTRPVFTTGDVIGCCINFISNQVPNTKTRSHKLKQGLIN